MCKDTHLEREIPRHAQIKTAACANSADLRCKPVYAWPIVVKSCVTNIERSSVYLFVYIRTFRLRIYVQTRILGQLSSNVVSPISTVVLSTYLCTPTFCLPICVYTQTSIERVSVYKHVYTHPFCLTIHAYTRTKIEHGSVYLCVYTHIFCLPIYVYTHTKVECRSAHLYIYTSSTVL